MSQLTEQIAKVAQRLGKTTRTIYRWHKAGCNLADPRSVEQFSEHLNASSRGRARTEAIAKQEPLVLPPVEHAPRGLKRDLEEMPSSNPKSSTSPYFPRRRDKAPRLRSSAFKNSRLVLRPGSWRRSTLARPT